MRRASDIPAAMVNLRIGVAEKLGANRFKILKEAGIDAELLESPTNRISVAQTMAVWNAIVTQTGSYDIGLLSGLKIRLQSLGILGYLMMNSQTIGKAFEKLCTYQRIFASIVFQNMVYEKGEVKIISEMQEEWQDDFRYTIDFLIAANVAMIRNNTPNNVLPIEIGFAMSEPSYATSYHELFSPTPVSFDCEKTFITYRENDLKSKVIGSNHEMFQYFESILQDVVSVHDGVNEYTHTTKNFIQKKLKAELPKIEEVAKEMTVSVRSLQKHLKEEGTSFQTLLNEVRKDISIQQLKNKQLNISDVAFLTGFSELSVFSRSFKKWTGLTPSQFQAQYV